MVPAGKVTDSVIAELAEVLESGDTVIDGGNSYYRDDIEHSTRLAEKGIRLLDCGTSGGVWGLERGYSLMIGGDDDAFAQVEPIFAVLGVDEGDPAPVLTGALDSRFDSRHFDEFTDKGVSAMRKQFGGHDEKPAL